MNRTTVLRRKLIYLMILVVMLIPLYLLGQPSGGGGEGGGQLAQLRGKYDIAESDLGEISPASETMKLASLGLRGVAASLLWKKSHDYRVMHEWDRLKATLNNIALLQPHFDKVWEFQAHNLAYNVSTEFDDYRQRYEMVREGTEFLTKGVNQNRKAPRLVWYTGWFYGQKMGMSDEKKQFRRLFSEDEKLHEDLLNEDIAVDSPEARGPMNKPDNWLVGRLWLYRGYDLVESGVQIRRQTPLNFYETGPKWRLKHAEAIEDEGVLDERAQNAWQLASADWKSFGNRSVPTTAAFTIKLGQLDELIRQREDKIEKLREVTGDAYVEAEAKAIEKLDPVQRDALSTPREERSKSQQSIAEKARQFISVDYDAVARAADPSKQLEALQLVEDVKDLDERILKTEGYRKQINYPYWDTLAMAEQEERTVRARRLIYEAEKANADAELEKAISLYEEAFEVWAEIFDDYPILVIDDTAEDLYDSLRRYRIAIDSDEIPDDFPLKTFIELMGEYGQVDQDMYEQVRQTQKELAAQRQVELEEEERRLEEAAAKEAAEAENSEADSEMKADEADKTEAADESEADEPESAESSSEEEVAEMKEEAETSEEQTDGEPAKEDESTSDGSDEPKPEPQPEPGQPEVDSPGDAAVESDESGS
ncbi:IRE (iron responsive element) [Rhodopirellula halodulae]|uniref:IRE (iron responsive element) n=1 Tax=Rhodopirellula halodulae TaxID=2894198 RepID=UPI001E38E8A0|nr:IRE (iron responsive element) [Rhodopirellula sp. JC737]MCC9657943.1 IRE (iron responsive element) [Rhodopirellula sp. JC737]